MKSTKIPLVLLAALVISIVPVYAQEVVEWWERPAPPVLPGRVAGVCYPWLVTEHYLVNLATYEVKAGTGGDIALSVDSCGQYFVVKAAFGVYAFSSKTGLIVDAIHLGVVPTLRYIGSTGNTIAVLDNVNTVVHVKIIGTNTSVFVPIEYPVHDIDYTFTQYVPVVVYSSVAGNAMTYFLANPGKTVHIPVYGTGAVLAHGNRMYIEAGGGLLALEIVDPITLSYTELFFIPLPVRLTDFATVVGNYLLAFSDEIIVRININEKSHDFRTAVTVGRAVPTPVGYFVPPAGTTYVVADDGIYPVPGLAVGRLNNIVFTNVLRRRDNALVPVMWALRPSTLVVTALLDGVLYDGEYAIRIKLEPGVYRAPRGAVISDGVRNIVLAEPEVTYPPAEGTYREPVRVSNIRYYVSSFPSQYLPIDRFNNVEFVASGSGRLLIIQQDKAVVYAGYGVSATIPGAWMHGGIGDCVVLYDGATYRLYDYSGEPIASYSYYLIRRPDHVTCRKVSVYDYVVEVYVGGYTEKITISWSEVRTEQNRGQKFEDPRGASVYYTIPPRIEYSGVVVPVPPDARDVRVSGFWATWMTASISILSIPESTVFVILNPPAGVTVFPLNNELFAVYFYEEKRLDILPYKAWFIQNCYVDVETNQEAELYLNDRYVATGPARLYVPCNTRVVIEARQVYHKPKRADVFVVGPTRIKLVPEPMIASVVLNVVAPRGLAVSAVVLRVDGFETTWSVGEVRTMLAKPTVFEVVEFLPFDACTKDVYTLNLVEGMNTLTVYCKLISPVLALTSSVPATVKLYVAGAALPSQIVYVTPEAPLYIVSPVGDVRLVSEPAVSGYVPKELTVSVYEFRVYEIDVTPYPMSRIIVYSNVPAATITVYNETGDVVATGVGSLEVEVVPGRYTVFASAPGYAPFSAQVEVPPGDAVTVFAELTAVAPVEVLPQEVPPWERVEFHLTALVAVAVAAVAVVWWKRRRARAVAEELVKGEEVA